MQLPPNRTGKSPASGSPVGGFTSERIDVPRRGRFQAVQQRLLRPATGAKAVAVGCEVTLEDRSQDVDNRRLYHPIAHRRDTQGSFLRAPRFGDKDTAEALRLAAALPQLFPQVPQVLERVVLKLLDRDVIDARGAPVGQTFVVAAARLPAA